MARDLSSYFVTQDVDVGMTVKSIQTGSTGLIVNNTHYITINAVDINKCVVSLMGGFVRVRYNSIYADDDSSYAYTLPYIAYLSNSTTLVIESDWQSGTGISSQRYGGRWTIVEYQ